MTVGQKEKPKGGCVRALWLSIAFFSAAAAGSGDVSELLSVAGTPTTLSCKPDAFKCESGCKTGSPVRGREEDAGPRSPSFVKQMSSAGLDFVFSAGENPSRMSLVWNHSKYTNQAGLLPPGFASL